MLSKSTCFSRKRRSVHSASRRYDNDDARHINLVEEVCFSNTILPKLVSPKDAVIP